MSALVSNIGTVTGTGATLSISVPAGGIPLGAMVYVGVIESGKPNSIGTVTSTQGSVFSLDDSTNFASGGNTLFGGYFHAFNSNAFSSGNLISYNPQKHNSISSVSAFYATGIVKVSNPIDTATKAHALNGAVTSGSPSTGGELFVGLATGASMFSYTQDTTNAAYATPPNLIISSTGIAVAGGNVVNSGASTLTFNPTTGSPAYLLFIAGFKVLVYTVLADTGSIAITGRDSTQVRSRPMTASTGYFIKTGNAAALSGTTHFLLANTGFFSITGNLIASNIYGLSGVTGFFGVGGSNVKQNLRWSRSDFNADFNLDFGPAEAKIKATTGYFTISGKSANLRPSAHPLLAVTGFYSISGKTTTLTSSTTPPAPPNTVANITYRQTYYHHGKRRTTLR